MPRPSGTGAAQRDRGAARGPCRGTSRVGSTARRGTGDGAPRRVPTPTGHTRAPAGPARAAGRSSGRTRMSMSPAGRSARLPYSISLSTRPLTGIASTPAAPRASSAARSSARSERFCSNVAERRRWASAVQASGMSTARAERADRGDQHRQHLVEMPQPPEAVPVDAVGQDRRESLGGGRVGCDTCREAHRLGLGHEVTSVGRAPRSDARPRSAQNSARLPSSRARSTAMWDTHSPIGR